MPYDGRMRDPLRSIEVEAPEVAECAVANAAAGGDEEAVSVRYERCRAEGSLAVRRLRDVTLRACDLSNASCTDLIATRVELVDCRLIGFDVSGGVLRDVRAVGCQIHMGRAFGTRFERCWFQSCDFREADFDDAQLDRITFRDCDLRDTRLASSHLGQTDVRGSRIEGIVVNPEHLGGAVIAPEQADVFAAALGLRVEPIGEE